MRNKPDWLTPERQANIESVLLKSNGHCIAGHKICLGYFENDYNGKARWHCAYERGNPCYGKYDLFASQVIERLIKDYHQEDREQAKLDYRQEQIALHGLGEHSFPMRGRFSAVSREIYSSNQPVFKIEGFGISGLTLTPFAKVKLTSSYMHLYVELGTALRPLSKNKRHKIIRYGKALPPSASKSISAAVRDYINH